MVKPLDISKFRKSLTKNIDGISVGFNDPKTWISTGNYLLNYIISGSFFKGVPLGKVSMFAGESSAGKSLIIANIMRNAQKQGIFVIAFDTENAHDEEWLKSAGVDTAEDKYLRIQVALVDDLAKSISTFLSDYKAQYGDLPLEEKPKVLMVVDSLGALVTGTDVDQFNKGDLRGNMGIKSKQLKLLISTTIIQLAMTNICLCCSNHTYESQDPFNPDPKISGGAAFVYLASQVIAVKKLNLKEDDDGNKTSTIQGIRTAVKVVKTRFCKPFETMQLKIPYTSGIKPYSGMVEYFEDKGILTKDGNRLKWTSPDGIEYKKFRKEWDATEGQKILQEIMAYIEKKDDENKVEIRNQATKQADELDGLVNLMDEVNLDEENDVDYTE